MEFPSLHSWDLSPTEAVALQRQLAPRLKLKAACDLSPQLVAGVDVSCRWHGERLHAAVVVLSLPQLEPVETTVASRTADFPYIPGLLSFRELPVVLDALQQLSCCPDLLLVDGQGIAHPRRFGIASHLGLWLGIPTIGCAKSRLFGQHQEPGERRGDSTPLLSPEGDEIGLLLRTRDRVKPLYVSPGHLIDCVSAAELVLDCGCGVRSPEPIRRAHLASNRQRLADEGI